MSKLDDHGPWDGAEALALGVVEAGQNRLCRPIHEASEKAAIREEKFTHPLGIFCREIIS
ncbi:MULTISPECIES: hypothetical protein [unclassified Azospirillum]|uniref:hypothetical protein n=1 Tax=unclassified Azospirillum TaxID=2630922 RepID=UPI001178C4BB|nr:MULTISPECIES: hypothetical protein [unclassified Azospirillum]